MNNSNGNGGNKGIWKRRALRGAAGLFLFAGLAAAGQEISRQVIYNDLVSKSSRIDIGGRSLHLECSGAGETTYVLEAGATGFAETWTWVQDALDDNARVCSYDRAGLGASDQNPEGFSPEHVASDLRAALSVAGETGPFVMVGHSLGGLLVRDFAATYPQDIAALVLVDPSHEEQLKHFPEDAAGQMREFPRMLETLALASSTGVLHFYSPLLAGASGLEGEALRAARFHAQSRTHLIASADEMAHWDEITERVASTAVSEELPVLVVSAGAQVPGSPDIGSTVTDLHADIANRFAVSRHITITGADHFTLLMQEEHAKELAGEMVRFIKEVRS